ncbi:MAG: hypothetical protein HXX12_10115 [Geothrix sp.]|uniref:hypothetical protein n=1 Tax=Geothrix sp. TaxID=1962974 RepID=UPI001807D180|nr:hypothetical protein [Geothrix sp.]NWJ41314.1 hypothetical protein [Geothrix sp.]WIL20698.1 MAG: hypothetical protein QOZ81_003281 [Geothrix sp.]
MQRRWAMALILASGLLAQTPPAEPPPAPAQVPAPEAKPAEVNPEVPAAKPFDQLRPTQRKLAYTLHRAALAAHELGTYRSHPRAIEVRETLKALVNAKLDIPEKASAVLPAAEAYLGKLRANHGLYDAEGKKLLLEGTWKDLQAAARAAAKTGPKGLEPRLAKIKGLLLDPKVDAAAPSWAEPEALAKGKKAKAPKGPKAPEGFSEQKAITALWVKRAKAWIEDTPQEVEINGEKKTRRKADPVQTKALNDLAAWLDKDDLDLLRDPGFGWLDLRRLGATPGATLLARAGDIAASKSPEGPVGELALLPAFVPVVGDAKFAKGEEKRTELAEVKLGPAPATAADQCAAFEKLGCSRDIDVK